MKQSIQRIMACFLVICTMLSMVPTVYAAGESTGIPDLLEPVNLGPAITSSTTVADQLIMSKVQGKDYLFIPIKGSQMAVYDLNAFTENPSNGAAVNVDVAETGIPIPRGGVECNGYIYIFGDSPEALYKYDPVTKVGVMVDIKPYVTAQYPIIRGLAVDDDKNLYISVEKSGIVKYDTKTDSASLLHYDPSFQYFRSIYDEGYIYCSTYQGVVLKVDANTGELKGQADHSNIMNAGLSWPSIAGDVFFGGASVTAKGMIAFDKETMEPVDVGIKGLVMGKVTTAKNGKHYFVTNTDGLCEFDPTTNKATKVMDFDKYLRCSEAFIEVDGTNYIFCCNNSGAWLLDPVNKTVKTYSENWMTNVSGKGTARSLASGVPGSNELWIGGYQNVNVSSYNTETQKFNNKVFQNGHSQTDAIIAYNGKLYLGCYNGAFLVEYDPATKTVRQLSLGMGKVFNQYRMHALAAGDNKVFFSTIADGTFGGIIGWYDLNDDTLYVATGYGQLNDGTYEEKLFHTKVVSAGDSTEDNIWTDEDGKEYSAGELKTLAKADKAYNFIPDTEGYQDPTKWVPEGLRGIVYHQNIINLEYDKGYLYCTSCTYPMGTVMVQPGADARRQKEAVLMVYDVNNKKKADEFFVTTGHDNVNGGIENLTTPEYISGVDVGKDGKLWGMVSETLFSFSHDATNRKLTVKEELSFGKTDYTHGASKYNEPKPILFDNQGYLYVGIDSKGIYQINCSTTSDNRRLATTTVNKYTLGEDGNLYYVSGYDLYKVALTDVAKVEQLINAIGTVTLESGEAIAAARTAYSALSVEDRAKINNYVTLQNAEIAFDALSNDYRAQLTVKYDFYNDVATLVPLTGYKSSYSGASMNNTNNQTLWNAAYAESTINNVYAGYYTSTTEKPLVVAQNSGNWKGIMFWSLLNDWLALKIKSPGEGDFDMSLDYYKNGNNATESSIYILPGDTDNIATALDTAVAQAKVSLRNGSGHQTVSIGKAAFEADKEYIIVFKSTKSYFGDSGKVNARMHLIGLTMTARFSTLEEAQTMAGTSRFHSVKLLYDEAASAVKDQIDAIGTVTLNSEAQIVATRAAYDALGDLQKPLVTNLQILIDAEAMLAELKAAIGYTANISTTSNEVNKGEKVSINVAVDYIAAEGQVAETVFNAGEISISYDSEKLAFNKDASTLGEATVSDGDAGTLKLADYGADKNFGTDVYVLVFDAIESGDASVEMTAAAFSNKSNATSNDLEDAMLDQAKVEVSIDVAHAVTLPEGFSGMLIAEDQKDYNFEAVDTNYDYTLSATVGGQPAEVKDNGDGTYTVAAVTGDLVISVADKKGKTYGVTFDGTGKDNMTDAEATATYGTNYVFTLPTEEGTVYGMDGITIGGNAYTGYTVSGKTYTIPGSAITGEVVITVTMESVPVTQVSVEVNGTGAGAATGFAPTAVKNKAYTLTITPEAGYDYQVTATMGGTEVANMKVDGNAYTIPNVTGNIVFTITASVNTDNVSVAEYLTLDGKKMWLVKNAAKLAEGKVSTYDGEVMFWSEEYKAYCYLVVADDLQADAAKALVGIKEGTAVTADYGMDVNMTGKVDANDAQLVYNMYNAAYADFGSNVTMEKFLRADVTADQKVDVNDAAAIIAHVLGIASN